jgi:flagellar basal-body rod modification protein FlgD
MDTSALNSLSQTSPTTGEAAKGKPAKKQLDQADFLHLMTVQMQYQDPLKPMDNQELTAQLTSFGSLNQLVDMNKKIELLQNAQLASTQLQATSLMGKEVSVQGDQVRLKKDGDATLFFQLASDTGRVSLHVVDREGNSIRTIEAGELKAGEQKVLWDGKDDKGKAVTAGDYTVEVDAFDAQGKKVNVATFIKGIVSGVDMSGSEVMVTFNNEMQAPLNAILAVRTPASV